MDAITCRRVCDEICGQSKGRYKRKVTGRQFETKNSRVGPTVHAYPTTQYKERGLQPTEAVLRATGSVQRENDPFHEFIEEHYILTNNVEDILAKKEVNAHFVTWCNGQPSRHQLIKRRILAFGNLRQAMREYGFDLAETQGEDGQSKEFKKRPSGSNNPVVVYGRIQLRDSQD